MTKLEDAVDEFNEKNKAKARMALGPYDRSIFIELPESSWAIKWNDIDGVMELSKEKPSWADFTEKMKEETGKKKSGDVV